MISQVHIGIGFIGKGIGRQIEEAAHRAVAQRAAAPLKIDVKGGFHHAHHSESFDRKGVAQVPFLQKQGDLAAHLEPFPGVNAVLHQAFVFFFRPAPLFEHRLVQGIRVVFAAQFIREGPHQHRSAFVNLDKGIQRVGWGHCFHAGLAAQSVDIPFGKTHGGFQLKIHQVLVFKILLGRFFHIGASGFDAGEKTDA